MKGFLEQQAQVANRKNRKLFLILFLGYILVAGGLSYALKDSINWEDYESRKVVIALIALSIVMFVLFLFGFVRSCSSAKSSKNLKLPFRENTKEEVGKIINREMKEGKVEVDEFLNPQSSKAKPNGDRIILTSTYLLVINGMGLIQAIPRNKIYGIIGMAGYKGGPYIVQIEIVTDLKVFEIEGTDVNHVLSIADKLNQYIPRPSDLKRKIRS